MTTRAARKLLPQSFFQARNAGAAELRCAPFPALRGPPNLLPPQDLHSVRELVVIRNGPKDDTPAILLSSPQQDPQERLPNSDGGNRKPPDERTLRLGKTVSVLHERLPTLLASPLPQEILSPHIHLHLFPSTHPHLPTVTGRISYTAALWTAPVAWGRVPVVGNVRLCVLSERMFNPAGAGAPAEKLIVRWRTCSKAGDGAAGDGTVGDERAGDARGSFGFLDRFAAADAEFSGLFIFEFDELGRVAKHTIEHAQRGGNWDRMTRVVSVTDWLLGLARRRRVAEEEGLALGCAGARRGAHAHRP